MTTIDQQQLWQLQYQAQARSPVAAYLMLIFLGLFGVHRFYLGREGTAVAQLVCTVTVIGLPVSVVWVLVDAYLTHQYVTDWNTRLIERLQNPHFT